MLIQGLQKLTLLDFPGHVACTVFLGGCDFRCPFCHNSSLIAGGEAVMDDAALLDLQYSEDSNAQVDLNCIMNELGEIIELQSRLGGI